MMLVAQIDSIQDDRQGNIQDGTADTEHLLYLYTDHLMTNWLATDQSRNVIWRWEGGGLW